MKINNTNLASDEKQACHEKNLHFHYAILRMADVKAKSGYPRSTLYRRITQGLWTKPVKIGDNAVGWPAHEVETLIAARIAGQTKEELQTLVKRLEDLRKIAMQHCFF
jgi:prophage regulatory protein